MEYIYRQLNLDRGDTIEVSLDQQANVRLMDSSNYSSFQAGLAHTYRGIKRMLSVADCRRAVRPSASPGLSRHRQSGAFPQQSRRTQRSAADAWHPVRNLDSSVCRLSLWWEVATLMVRLSEKMTWASRASNS
jgi:hypothetical protein